MQNDWEYFVIFFEDQLARPMSISQWRGFNPRSLVLKISALPLESQCIVFLQDTCKCLPDKCIVYTVGLIHPTHGIDDNPLDEIFLECIIGVLIHLHRVVLVQEDIEDKVI